ncbi:MAG: hypothetical protein NVS1B3_03060 [Candidatus Dormibacteraceae bacterium]
MSEANERWRRALDDWRIPAEILAAAPESPWEFPVGLFEKRADASRERWTRSNAIAFDTLPEGGSVLDVGCGAGAASLPLTRRAKRLIGVDSSPPLLAEFRHRAALLAAEIVAIEGSWPEVDEKVEQADVVVCHHVAYNVPDLAGFALALTRHARRGVVLELTLRHPMSDLNRLWLRFHNLKRPDHPTADDAEQVLREAGLPVLREDWSPDEPSIALDREQMVAWTRRRLCLTPDRDPEVEEALAELSASTRLPFGMPPRRLATFHWEPSKGL